MMALTAAMLFAPGTAFAQSTTTTPTRPAAPAEEAALPQETLTDGSALENTADIIVTGTSIRGVAPIGSNLVSVGQATIEKTAPINVSQLVNTVPAITTSGSVSQGENAYSYYSPQIHSLAGSSSNTTLVIMDGLRLPGGGTQFAQTDPNIIPIGAIERVEVLADGASSVYGSDAVAGVVNFITRRTYDGLEVNARYGFADDYHNYDINGIWGTKWDNGGVYIAGSYSKGSTLFNKDRSFASMGDYRPVGGTNTNSFACNPATIQVTGRPGGAANPSGVYLSPSATSTVSNTAINAPCNNSIYTVLLSGQWRANGMMKVYNEFSDKFRITAMLNYNIQKTTSPNGPGTLNGATAFGRYDDGLGNGAASIFSGGVPSITIGTNTYLTPQVNPFFVAPAGSPDAIKESVSWLALRDDGNYGYNESESDSIYATFVAEYDLTDSWSVKFSDAFGRNRSAGNTIDGFCNSCALLALNGTAQLSGSTTTSDIAGQNVIALNLPLNAGNALDVWRTGSANRTSAAVLRSLYGADSQNTNFNTFNQIKLDFQGGVFDLPAGEVKVAFGGEHYWADETQKINNANGTGPSVTGATFRQYMYERTVNSAYAEIVVPVISPDMDIPFFRRVDVNISGRYDKYSDVGGTTNPKFAANWELFEGVKLRGNYATAFVAPPLAVIGDPTQGYLYASGSVGVQPNTINVPVANYAAVKQVPGAVITNTQLACNDANLALQSATTCTIGQVGVNQGLRRQLGGGFSNMVPQKGTSYSFGLDLAPRFLPGFMAAVTWFHNTFDGGVSSPSPTAIVNSAGLRNLLQIFPTGMSQAQIDEFANIANGATIGGAVPANVYFTLDQSSRNALNLIVEGIDFQTSYRTPIGDMGNFTVGISGTYFTKFRQNFGGGTDFDILNTSGYNTTFPSVQYKHRAQLGWELGGISADLFWNHTGSYRNWISTSVVPIATNSVGNPTGGGDKVKADNTFDLHLQYTIRSEGSFNGWQAYVDVKNLFDKTPPYYNGNTAGIIGGAWGYNGFVSNPLGRLISVGLRTRF
ncbi:TonB-dependent receptor [Sphingomonas sp. ZT3P38]|uniref:TonB-dependent receptor domain-containing protein n=1 Tax=Parasphingomonas zepuensis TaxID=3096161 RepID=UPI002FCBB86F